MKKYILGLLGIVFVSTMIFGFSSCKDNNEEEAENSVASIYGTWRHYTNETKGYYEQITLKEDGILIWREVDDYEDETCYDTYTYENGNIIWHDGPNADDIEAIWHVAQLTKSNLVTYDVEDDGSYDNQTVWIRIE